MNMTGFANSVRLAELQAQGILLTEGHFDYGNGFHGTSYLNAHSLMHDPAKVMDYAHQLTDKLGSEIRKQTQMVIGPITGGALLAFAMAVAIDASREFGPNGKVLFAPIYESSGQLVMRKHYQQIIAGGIGQSGKRVIVVDDVCNTGETLRRSRNLVDRYGGQVLCSAVLFDREARQNKPEDYISLERVNFNPELVPADTCPQCRFNIPITQF